MLRLFGAGPINGFIFFLVTVAQVEVRDFSYVGLTSKVFSAITFKVSITTTFSAVLL